MANIELAKAYVTIVPSMEGAQRSIEDGLNDASASAGRSAGTTAGSSFSGAFGNGIRTASRVVAGTMAAASTAVVAFGGSAVQAGMSFDSSMSQVAATMGTTVDQIEDLRNFAQEMGSTTAFSATQAADALNYMALAGYDAETSMNMLPNVLNLAAAGGIDLASASDMVTDASSALGLSLDETATMVDQMAQASSISNTSVAQLGEAFLTLGATGANAEGGTNELATVLGVLADNGIKGSEAGTHLRNMILSLTNPTSVAAQTLESLGISAYDSEGNMRNMVDVISDLQNATSSLTQEQSDSIVSTIFNRADLASVNALLNTSTERYEQLTEAIASADGASQSMANTQLDNLAGDTTLFQSALEGAQIAVSDSLNPTLRDFVQLGTDGISRVTTAFQEGGLEGAMGELGTWLSEALGTVVEKTPEIVSAGIQLLSALGNGLVENAPLIADSALEVLQTLVDNFTESVDSGGVNDLASTALTIIEKLGNFLVENIPSLMSATSELIAQLVSFMVDPENMAAMTDLALQLIVAVADGLVMAIPNLVSVLPEIFASNITAITTLFPEILSTVGTLLGDLAMMVIGLVGGLMGDSYDEVVENLTAVGDFLSEGFTGFINTIKDFCSDIGTKISDLWSDISDFFTNGVNSIGETLSGWWTDLQTWFGDLISSALTWGSDLIDNFVSGITGGIGNIQNAVSNVAQTVRDFIGFSEPERGPLSNFHTYAPDMLDLFEEGLKDGTPELEATLNRTLTMPSLNSVDSLNLDSYEPSGRVGGDLVIPVSIGQERLDTIIIRAEQLATFRRGG